MKKMMKKVALLLIPLMAFMFAGCSDDSSGGDSGSSSPSNTSGTTGGTSGTGTSGTSGTSSGNDSGTSQTSATYLVGLRNSTGSTIVSWAVCNRYDSDDLYFPDNQTIPNRGLGEFVTVPAGETYWIFYKTSDSDDWYYTETFVATEWGHGTLTAY